MARLALRGAPVEEVEDLAAGLRDIVVGQVLDARPHPNADRLTLCRVLGPDGEVPVVCGAPDVRSGSFYPFAPVGARLPGGFRIGKRKIRGHFSQGMLCSERELELGDDQAGIMLLEGDYEAGAPFAPAAELDDHRLDVEVTPNRGDLLSHVGIARELHPVGQGGIVLPAFPASAGAVCRTGRFARPGRFRERFRRSSHPYRGSGALLALPGRGDPRCDGGPVAAVAGEPAESGGGAADQQRRGRHQLRHAGAGAAVARLRPGQAGRRDDRRGAGASGGDRWSRSTERPGRSRPRC